MARRNLHILIQHLMALTLSLPAIGAGVRAYQPPEKQETDTEASQQFQFQNGRSKRTDRYGDPLPQGTIARLGTLRQRAVWANVGLSADGKTIITATQGRIVKFWDADTGKLRQQRELPIGVCDQASLSPDGRLLAVQESNSDSPLDIWDIASGKRLHRIEPQQGQWFHQPVFSHNGDSLAVEECGLAKSTIRLWNVSSGKEQELTGQALSIGSLAFSPDGKILAAYDGLSLICWNVATGERLWQTDFHFDSYSLTFTPDSRTIIASPAEKSRTWHTWDAATGKLVDRLKLPKGHTYADLAVAPDGRTLVFFCYWRTRGGDGRVRLWDMKTGKMLHVLTAEGEIGPFFPDGKSFLTNDGALQRWELATGRPLLPDTNAMGHRAEVCRAVYSSDGRRLASAAGDGAIILWDLATAKPLHILRGHEFDATDLAFTTDGKHLVSGGSAGKLHIQDTVTGKVIRRIPLYDPKIGEEKERVLRLHPAADGRAVVVLGYDPAAFPPILSRWDLGSGKQKSRARLEWGRWDDAPISACSPDGRMLALAGKVQETTTGTERVRLNGSASLFVHYTFSADGRKLAGVVTQNTETVFDPVMRLLTKMDGIRIWDAASGRVMQSIPTNRMGQLAFSPDGRYLAGADMQGIRLWELASGQVVLRHKAHERIRGTNGESFASCLCFAPDGRTVATGHLDSTVLIWDMVPPSRLSASEDLSRLWVELLASDAARAYAAYWRMADIPTEAIRFLREGLHPVSPAPAEQVRPLLSDLDSDEYRKRESAAARLREMGDRAAGFLREALKARPSLEMRRRLEDLLKDREEPPCGEELRQLRALAVLERIGTSEARQVLKTLARGMPEARVTREAKASLERLTARHVLEKR